MTISFAPVNRDVARAFVAEHHSHHQAHVGEKFAIGALFGGVLAGVVVAGRTVAPGLADIYTREITRLCCANDAPHCTASRLLGRIGRVAAAAGVTLLVSYTRIDERGTCYLAASFAPVAIVAGRAHNTGNRALRWLPGLYEPSTEVVDRVRWERGARATRAGARWDAVVGRWVASASEAA